MNKHIKSIITLAGALCALPLGSAHAEDNITNIISGTTVDNATGWYVVGQSGTNNYLEMNSGGKLINCGGAVIGNEVGANNNNALVAGSGSLWETATSGAFILGQSGPGNSLTINSGGSVNAGGNLYLGHFSADNSLTISNGGVLNSPGENYIGDGTAASNNTVVVTGAGSVWNGSAVTFMVGNNGSSNSLTIADGAQFNLPTTIYPSCYVGYVGGNNRALVTGAGSVLNAATATFVGTYSSGNSLTIANGGTVNQSGGTTFVGFGGSTSLNTYTITGAGSTLNAPNLEFWVGYDAGSANNVLNLGNGGLLKGYVLVANGAGSVINLGDGTVPATANVYYLELRTPTARLNINAGVVQALYDVGWLIAGSDNVYIQSGGAVIDSKNRTVGINSSITLREDVTSPGGGLTKIGTGTLSLGGVETYTGATTVSNGTLRVNGAIGIGAVTVASGATLGGSGVINGPVTVPVGATLQPGLGDLDTSTLTINHTLTLAGTTVLALNRTNAQTASKVSGITTLTLGGVLSVVNVGDALQAGDTFLLVSASSVTSGSSFAATNLPSLDSGLTWNFDGRVLTVMGNVDPTPTNIVYGVSGSTLTLTWPGSHLGWVAQSNSVNVANASSWFDIAGSQTVTTLSIPIDRARTSVFYRLRLP